MQPPYQKEDPHVANRPGCVAEWMTLAGGLLTVALFTLFAIFAGFSVPAYADVDEDSISYGCAGGFTGGGGGVLVQRDGGIYRWSVPSHRDPVTRSFLRLDRAAAMDLFAEFARINFAGIRYNKPSNMTCQITLRQGASTHAVAWPLGDSDAPSEVLALASRIEQLAKEPPVEPK